MGTKINEEVSCMSEGHDILKAFVDEWKRSFDPPRLKIESIWSDYLVKWLWDRYHAWFEYYVDPSKNKTRLDAAIWLNKKGKLPMDLAIECEWGKGYTDECNENFATGDFVKLLTMPAKAGLAIIGTPAHGKSNKKNNVAEKIIERIKKSYAENKKDNRPMGVIEVRKVNSETLKLEQTYECWYHNLGDDKQPIHLENLSGITMEGIKKYLEGNPEKVETILSWS
ncbi:MAG TPA: hypothetical protein VFF54_04725 [Thermodesulfobacteriota bacterium]|nr:hypothetical protein [Thermodesulfobacteriota bacterium]